MTQIVRPDAKALERQKKYLESLRRKGSVAEAAKAAGVRVDSIPHWRTRYPEFLRRETEIREAAEVIRAAARTRQCVCEKTFVAKYDGQEFCSRSCATREVKTAYWGPKDSLVLEELRRRRATRAELIERTQVLLASIRSILNRLHRRGLIKRTGASRGPCAVWVAT